MYCTAIIADERGLLLDNGVYGVGGIVTEHQPGPLPGKSKSVDAATGSCPFYAKKTVIHDPLLSKLKVPAILHGKRATSIPRNPASNKPL
jgi:hypothetical protein